MSLMGRIMDATNAFLGVTNYGGAPGVTVSQTTELPLGTSDGTATGTVAVKVLSIGGSGASGATSTNATYSSVNASTTSQTMHIANASRKGISIYNNADKVLHLSYATPATAATSVADLAAETGGNSGGYYEAPYGYTGAIYGIWEPSPTGTANIVEFT